MHTDPRCLSDRPHSAACQCTWVPSLDCSCKHPEQLGCRCHNDALARGEVVACNLKGLRLPEAWQKILDFSAECQRRADDLLHDDSELGKQFVLLYQLVGSMARVKLQHFNRLPYSLARVRNDPAQAAACLHEYDETPADKRHRVPSLCLVFLPYVHACLHTCIP